MTSSALDIYRDTLSYQLGENSPITEIGIYDPTGENLSLYGVLDDNTYQGDKDGGQVTRKLSGCRFVISDKLTFEVYDNIKIYFPTRDKTYTIEYQETDLQGAQVLWLY
jgi:hypothetical protein